MSKIRAPLCEKGKRRLFFFYFDERTMLFSSKDAPPPMRVVEFALAFFRGRETSWNGGKGAAVPKKTRAHAREEKRRDGIPLSERKYRFGEKIYRFAVKSLRTRTKDATGRFDANGEGRAVERECRAGNKGSRRGVDDESVSTRALCSGDDGSKTIEVLWVS